ncbi:MAG: 4'-phosphopantetheinyl transferase superfamily protein [Cyanobacteria bacterium J06642_2]
MLLSMSSLLRSTSFQVKHQWSIPPASDIEIGAREVHVWRVRVAEEIARRDRWRALLSDDERERADRFKFQRDRDRFTVVRGILRTLLGQYLGREPRQVKFVYGKYGKPELAAPLEDHPLQFNLSHSGDMALVAFSQEKAVGVDIEQMRADYPCEDIVRRFFSPNEREQFNQFPDALKPQAFFHCWTRKEAFVKALGGGMAGVPLDQFTVEFRRDRPAALLQTNWVADASQNWSFQDLQAHPEYAAAVAIAACGVNWQYWDWGLGPQ